jgi:hypothetical protein
MIGDWDYGIVFNKRTGAIESTAAKDPAAPVPELSIDEETRLLEMLQIRFHTDAEFEDDEFYDEDEFRPYQETRHVLEDELIAKRLLTAEKTKTLIIRFFMLVFIVGVIFAAFYILFWMDSLPRG